MFHIAFVEDNPSEILLTKVTCEDLKFTVEEKVTFFEDEVSIMKTLDENPNLFDLIFLDVNIGNISGFDVLRMFRQRKLLTPVFMYSNSNNPNDLENSKLLHASGYIQKPYEYENMRNLIQLIRTSLNNKSIETLIKNKVNLLS